jgi:hypothetical protein
MRSAEFQSGRLALGERSSERDFMPPAPPNSNAPQRCVGQAALVCFSIAALSFVACALGLLVHQALTGSLAISGSAAIGLIFLAMGLLNLGYEADLVEVVVNTSPEKDDRIAHTAWEMGHPAHAMAPRAGDESAAPLHVAFSPRA